jgi:hypothetical protein
MIEKWHKKHEFFIVQELPVCRQPSIGNLPLVRPSFCEIAGFYAFFILCLHPYQDSLRHF